MTRLSVNLNAVAQLRNRRNLPWPSVTGLAKLVLDAGAAGITVHPRPDERHIRRSDVIELSDLLRHDYPTAEFNIEGYPSEDFIRLVQEVAPHQVTLVPDDPAQATSDHGWDFAAERGRLAAAVARLHGPGTRVSLFCDPDAGGDALQQARSTGAERVELFTGPYGCTYADATLAQARLGTLAATAAAARAAGFSVNAGHDLTLGNLPAFLLRTGPVAEVSIGHAITADALLVGFPDAVRRYNAVLGNAQLS